MIASAWWDPSDLDPFEFWRWLLAVVCTVYAAVVTGRSLWDWAVWLSGHERTTSLMRRYLLVQFLRLRLRRFAGELAGIAFWAAAFVVLVWLHRRTGL